MFYLAIGLIAIVGAVAAVYSVNPTYRLYLKALGRHSLEQESGGPDVIGESDLAGLPRLVQGYLRYVGVPGRTRVRFFRCSMDGKMRLDPSKPAAPVVAEQTNFIPDPVRLFYMKMRFKGLGIRALHHYQQASATMKIKILDLLKVVDARGPEMNQGETVTVFNDMCILAPQTLIDSRILWQEINDQQVKASFCNCGITVSAVLSFGEDGRLIDFRSEDRFYAKRDGSFEKIPWSTPIDGYHLQDGLMLPWKARAVWHLADGDFTYATMRVKDVSFA